MADFSKFPDTHHRMRGRYSVRLDDGTQVSLEISTTSRSLRGNELVKASMAMQMGRPVSHRVDEDAIALFIGRSGRREVEVTNSGQYRCGRLVNRSLRSLVEEVVERVAPQPTSADIVEEPGPSFSR
ncbi:hypothetical protein G6L37_01210 [Agrobacterium rubi]|nr:hypothetical protein [Agrobacterium rubi]NTF24010.1 hypothetical protein [Agrobacterium rubi]